MRLGIKYTIADKTYFLTDQRKEELWDQRKDYAVELAQYIQTGQHFVFVDETTFNTHLKLTRTWQRKGSRISLENAKRIGKCTLYGAIGTCFDGPVYYTGESTNVDDFKEFTRLVIAKLPRNCKPVLVYDNHRAHVST